MILRLSLVGKRNTDLLVTPTECSAGDVWFTGYVIFPHLLPNSHINNKDYISDIYGFKKEREGDWFKV